MRSEINEKSFVFSYWELTVGGKGETRELTLSPQAQKSHPAAPFSAFHSRAHGVHKPREVAGGRGGSTVTWPSPPTRAGARLPSPASGQPGRRWRNQGPRWRYRARSARCTCSNFNRLVGTYSNIGTGDWK